MTDRRFVIFDTETTGLERRAPALCNVPGSIEARGSEICQIGGIVCNYKMEPVRGFCHYCDTVAAESGAQAHWVHGISQREVREYLAGQYFSEVAMTLLPELFEPNTVFVGYNSEFDLGMISQGLDNAPCDFTWKPCMSPVIPKTGRWSVDVMKFFPAGKSYRKLSSFTEELATTRDKFLSDYFHLLSVDTNCAEILSTTWKREHNAFFDALNTFLLWRDKIWRVKLL